MYKICTKTPRKVRSWRFKRLGKSISYLESVGLHVSTPPASTKEVEIS